MKFFVSSVKSKINKNTQPIKAFDCHFNEMKTNEDRKRAREREKKANDTRANRLTETRTKIENYLARPLVTLCYVMWIFTAVFRHCAIQLKSNESNEQNRDKYAN